MWWRTYTRYMVMYGITPRGPSVGLKHYGDYYRYQILAACTIGLALCIILGIVEVVRYLIIRFFS